MVQPANKRLVTEATLPAHVATQITTPGTDTATALNATIDTQVTTGTTQKIVHGGRVPKTVRAPVLTVEKSWPDRNVDYRVLWQENNGLTLYAIGYDFAFRKSTDGGKTWTRKGVQGFGTTAVGAFLKTPTGTLIMMRPGSTMITQRSTDDGANWATVASPTNSKSGHYAMGSQSWCVDPVTGYLYYGEYSTSDNQATISLWRSTDDGATWAEFHAFPATASASVDKIRHIHSVQWDHVMQRVIIMTGDSSPASGMYRVNAAGTGVEPLLLNRDVPGIPDAARAIGIIPFPDYLCWTGDSTGNPYLMRMARTEIGKVNPVVERLYRLNSTGWFTCKASSDGARWVFSASQESPSRLDTSAHLYAVEDQGNTIYEVGALPVGPNGLAAISPLGLPEMHGDVFFMQAHNAGRDAVWKMQLAQGAARMDWPQERPAAYFTQTINSGPVSVPAMATDGDGIVFGHAKVAATATKLHIYDAGVAAHAGDAASIRLQIRVKGNATPIYTSFQNSERAAAREEASVGPIATLDVAAQAVLEFRILSAGAGLAYDGTAFVAYGFGY